MRFVASWDSGGPDFTTALDARSFREALDVVQQFQPKATRVELRVVSDVSSGAGVWRLSRWLRFKGWVRRCFGG